MSDIADVFPQSAVQVRRIDQSLLLTGQVETPADVAILETIARAAFPGDRLLNLVRPFTLDQQALSIRVVQIRRTTLAAPEIRRVSSLDAAKTLDAWLGQSGASTLLESRLTAADGRAARISLTVERPTPVARPDGGDATKTGLDLRATTLDIAVTPTRTVEGQIRLNVSIGVGQPAHVNGRDPVRPATFSSEALLASDEAMAVTGLGAALPATPSVATVAETAIEYAVMIEPEAISRDR